MHSIKRMNKKLLKISAVLIPIVLIGVFVKLFLNFQEKKEKTEALKNVPTFNLQTISGTSLTSDDLHNNTVRIIVYFSTTCHFCIAEAEKLSKIHRNYNNIQWIWAASEPLEEIREFAAKHGLNQQRNILWCHDEQASLYRKMGLGSVPYFLVYDKNNHLIRRNSGAVKLENLINTIDEKK